MLKSEFKYKIENLEIHISNSCNLTCTSCAHYSNQGHKGNLSLETAEQWMEPWANKLEPSYFSLLGGEPTLNNQLTEILYLSKKMWSNSKIRIVTNGLYLFRHPNLPKALSATNSRLAISIHHDSEEYLKKMESVKSLVNQWKLEHEFEVIWRESYSNWTRRYIGFGKNMKPYNDNKIELSWQQCPAKYCPQIYQGMIWKCPALAYLKMQDDKYDLSDDWNFYLTYNPLPPTANIGQIKEFFSRKAENYCNMCPSRPELIKIDSPLIPISKLVDKC